MEIQWDTNKMNNLPVWTVGSLKNGMDTFGRQKKSQVGCPETW